MFNNPNMAVASPKPSCLPVQESPESGHTHSHVAKPSSCSRDLTLKSAFTPWMFCSVPFSKISSM